MSSHTTDAISEVATYEKRVKQERVRRGENEKQSHHIAEKPERKCKSEARDGFWCLLKSDASTTCEI